MHSGALLLIVLSEQTSAAVSSLRSCRVGVSPLEGARRPVIPSYRPTLVMLTQGIKESGLAALLETLPVLCCSSVANYHALSEVQYHMFPLSETLSHGCLLWPLKLVIGRYSGVSTKLWTCSTHRFGRQAVWDAALWWLVSSLYQISCYGQINLIPKKQEYTARGNYIF